MVSTSHQIAIELGVSEKTLQSWNKSFKLATTTNNQGQVCYDESTKEQLLLIYHLIKDRGFTISGAKQELKKAPLHEKKQETISKLAEVRQFLSFLKEGI